MKCSNPKCRKELIPYGGSSAICRCMDCRQYFCDEEGEILKEDKWIDAVKGNTNRTIYDFLCYGCEAKKRELKEQNKRVARITDERERAEMLEKQRLHSSDMLKADYEELEKLPKIGNTISDMKRGFHGEVRSCSVYDKLYGSKWPSKDKNLFNFFSL